MKTTEKLYTKEEFLERFPISEWAFRQQILSGELIAIEINNEILIPESSICVWYNVLLNTSLYMPQIAGQKRNSIKKFPKNKK